MAATSKKTSKSVAFTTDEADQTLLKEIDSLLAQQEYASFSDLCKDALEQFFFPETSQPTVDAGDSGAHDSGAQLVQIQTQLEQVSSSAVQILEQLQQQSANLEQATAGDAGKLEAQVTKLAQQLKQVDTRTSQLLTQIQRQVTDLEQHLGEASGSAPSADLEEKLTTITEKVERVEARTAKVLKELQQKSTEPAAEFDTEALEATIARHIATLTERIGAVETKTDDRFKQLQKALATAEETAADREEQYLTQLEEQFSRLLEQLTPPEPEPEPEPEIEQFTSPEPQGVPRRAVASSDDPLLSRLSVLIEDF